MDDTKKHISEALEAIKIATEITDGFVEIGNHIIAVCAKMPADVTGRKEQSTIPDEVGTVLTLLVQGA
jgi:hypothetical protein